MGLYDHFQTAITFANLTSFIKTCVYKYNHTKPPVKKDLMWIILFRTYERLKLYMILCMFCVLIIFYIYQTT